MFCVALQISAIERVQNGAMLEAYQNQRDYMERKYAPGFANGGVRTNARSAGEGLTIERELWHGSKQVDPHQASASFALTSTRTAAILFCHLPYVRVIVYTLAGAPRYSAACEYMRSDQAAC